jgi:hypothetical protein
MVTSQNMNESEMGNRGSKSDIGPVNGTYAPINTSVKEQRVDGNCFCSVLLLFRRVQCPSVPFSLKTTPSRTYVCRANEQSKRSEKTLRN